MATMRSWRRWLTASAEAAGGHGRARILAVLEAQPDAGVERPGQQPDRVAEDPQLLLELLVVGVDRQGGGLGPQVVHAAAGVLPRAAQPVGRVGPAHQVERGLVVDPLGPAHQVRDAPVERPLGLGAAPRRRGDERRTAAPPPRRWRRWSGSGPSRRRCPPPPRRAPGWCRGRRAWWWRSSGGGSVVGRDRVAGGSVVGAASVVVVSCRGASGEAAGAGRARPQRQHQKRRGSTLSGAQACGESIHPAPRGGGPCGPVRRG